MSAPSPFKIFLKFKWFFFWFNFYFCIATEVSTHKKTSVLYDSLFFKVLYVYQHWFMESHFLLSLSQTLFLKDPFMQRNSTEHQSFGVRLDPTEPVSSAGHWTPWAVCVGQGTEAGCTDILAVSPGMVRTGCQTQSCLHRGRSPAWWQTQTAVLNSEGWTARRDKSHVPRCHRHRAAFLGAERRDRS